MKILKKNKKRLLIAIVLLLIPCIVYVIYYFSYYKPIKDAVVKISFEYAQFNDAGYMLPNEYQTQPEKMPQSEIDKLKQSCKNKIDTLFIKDSDCGSQEYIICNQLIDDLVAKKFTQVSSITKLKEIKDFSIKNNVAKVTLIINNIVKSTEDGAAMSYNTSYTFALIKENEGWKIKDITFRPLGI